MLSPRNSAGRSSTPNRRSQSPMNVRTFDDALVYKTQCEQLSIHPLKDVLYTLQSSNDVVLKLQLNSDATFTDLQSICQTLQLINRQVALRIHDLRIGNKGLVMIGDLMNKNDNLRSLILKNTDITSMGIPYLCNGLNSSRCQLQELEITQSSIGQDGLEQLCTSLCVNLSLKRLILNSLNLFDSSVSSICRLIESNNNINLLVLENNGFTHHGKQFIKQNTKNLQGMFKICESLSRNRGVEELVMSGNPIGNEGLIALSDFHLTRLTRIELDSCKIGLGGLELFIRNLISPSMLYKMQTQILNLANNRIGTSGAKQLFQTLSQSFPALRALNLHNNKIGNQAMPAVNSYLKSPTNRLERLNLSQNLTDDSGAQYLSEIFQYNRIIREINLQRNFVSQTGQSNIYIELSKWNSETKMNISDQLPKNSEFYMEENSQVVNESVVSPQKRFSPSRFEENHTPNIHVQQQSARRIASPRQNISKSPIQYRQEPNYNNNSGYLKRSNYDEPSINKTIGGPVLSDSLEEYNRKIDENARDIVILFQRRKDLLLAKKLKLQENYVNNVNLTKHQRLDEKREELNYINMKIGNYNLTDIIQKNEFFLRAQTFTGIMTNELENRSDESNRIAARLQDFWTNNRALETEVENGLKRLNQIDDQLDQLNLEIIDNCKSLDMTEERIRELLAIRTAEHISQAEPFFVQKQRVHENLEQSLTERNIHNDEKLAKISQIIAQLENLRYIREERLRLLHEVFDDKDNSNFSQRLGILTQIIDQIENMIAMKKNFNHLCAEEETLNAQIQKVQADIDILNNEFIERHNEEARLYKVMHENLFARTQINKVVEYLAQQGNIPRTSEEDLRNLLTIFKDKYAFFKQFIEEDYKVVDGLKKTNDTINRLNHLVDSISHEKLRRTDLYQRLENIANIKSEEYNKSEALRKLDVEITKKERQKSHIEEDLMYMRNEADLETYKKIGQVLNIHENSLGQLGNERVYLIREIDKLNQQIYQQISQCKAEYEDVLKEIFPSDWVTRFDLTRLQDITYVKATMTHTFKRLGIKKEDILVN